MCWLPTQLRYPDLKVVSGISYPSNLGGLGLSEELTLGGMRRNNFVALGYFIMVA